MSGVRIRFSDYYQPKPKQKLAHNCLAKYILFGGAMGGGKSWWLCMEAILQCIFFPGNRCVLIRETWSILTITTMVTFGKVCPPELLIGGRVVSGEARFKNGSLLIFMGVDIARDPTLNKLRGLEIGWAGVDEANEIPEEVFNILKARLRWICFNKVVPRYGICLTSNPENCWLKPTFILNQYPDHAFIQSLTTDNYSEDSEYIATLKDAFKGNEDMLNRFLRGSWEDADAANQLIPQQAIVSFFDHVPMQNEYVEYATAADIARFGDDKTTIPTFYGNVLETIDVYQKLRAFEIADILIDNIEKKGIDLERVGIDAIGIGSGVVDSLFEKGYQVYEINSGEAPDEDMEYDPAGKTSFKPNNKRTLMYWWLMEDMRDGIIGAAGNLPKKIREELEVELSSIRYDFASDKRVKILAKSEIKKRIGRSPDLADSLAYANYMRRKQYARQELTIFV